MLKGGTEYIQARVHRVVVFWIIYDNPQKNQSSNIRAI